jgi:hypothetical protein
MKVEQKAGRVGVCVFTDGSPLLPVITIRKSNGELIEARVSMAELHDLRYCVDRVLAQLGVQA